MGAALLTTLPSGAACTRPAPDADVYADATTHSVGEFRLQSATFAGSPALRVTHVAEPERTLWESYPGRGYLATGSARTEIAENDTPASGFTMTDVDLVRMDRQTVDSIQLTGAGATAAAALRGTLAGGDRTVGYTMTFTQPLTDHLRFEVRLDSPDISPLNRLFLSYRCAPEEHFVGFGQQLTYIDQKGRRLPVLVQEHGVGRGLPVVTEAVSLRYGPRTAGDWYTTEVSVPHYLTTLNRSMFLESTEYSVFDLRAPDSVEIELFAGVMTGRILRGTDPLALIEAYTAYAGRMRPLPDWVHEGVIVAVQGGTERALAKLQELVTADVPVCAFWIQDWVGQRTTPGGQQLWWDWRLDPTHYPNWPGLLDALRNQRGARMLVYINPFLANQPGHDELYIHAIQNGYLVKRADGSPVLIPNAGFSAGLIDLSNPAARTWIKGIIKDRLISGAGASGWMADFGEALPFDAVLSSGEDAAAWHNRYPQEWARLNREAIEEAGHGEDALFFSRSGYTQSPGISTLFWVGDQLQTWDAHDGIKSALTGMLSGGISGFSLVHSDTGGFDSLAIPLPQGRSVTVIHRSKELLQELSALTPVFRTHEGLDPAVAWQFDSDPDTLAHLRRCTPTTRRSSVSARSTCSDPTCSSPLSSTTASSGQVSTFQQGAGTISGARPPTARTAVGGSRWPLPSDNHPSSSGPVPQPKLQSAKASPTSRSVGEPSSGRSDDRRATSARCATPLTPR